ncbi:diguanylate cyclase [Paramagnetospirillum magneticum]|uniref:diguanylate cyclase n=1 Tax=Paramagnetospirillum magneticum (strain ATCC 700264 / AMB-1) TaxID=342108 RepID=Q2W260_PARM1|nr:diguanylate cyclase [Paramagnetospirillum magneticum]BAE52065.1 FOG: GGDEF domain [Paramagnetospirillum magneticum AMB-1]
MSKLDEIDIRIDSTIGASVGTLVSRILEQQAQLADQRINQTLLTELVEQFVASERRLAEAHATVLAMSRTDALTGIANRRWFDESLAQELARANRSKTSLGLLLMDIDCFKLFNDNYGHSAGDDCLQAVAQAVQSIVRRPPDLAARYGGEELVCILPDTDAKGVEAVGNAVLEAVRGLAIPHAFSKAVDIVTVSIGGVSLIPTEATTPKQIIEAADSVLYASKEGGRNRLTMVDAPMDG